MIRIEKKNYLVTLPADAGFLVQYIIDDLVFAVLHHKNKICGCKTTERHTINTETLKFKLHASLNVENRI